MADVNVTVNNGPALSLSFDGAGAVAAAGYASAASASAVNAAAAATAAAGSTNTFVSTSTTSLTIGTGSRSLTVGTGKQFQAGQYVLISDSADTTQWMSGTVTSYNSGTGALVVNSLIILGSGTYATWNVSVCGPPGSGTNATTLNGKADTAFMQVASNGSDIANAATFRSNLGLGSASTLSIGTSGHTVPALDGANTWSQVQALTQGLTSASDITVNRASSSSPTTGLMFFGNTGTHYLYHDGSNYQFVGPGSLFAPTGGFNGPVTGNVTGSCTGSSGSCTGNASSASTAATVNNGAITPAKLSANGPSWDGSGNLSAPGTLFSMGSGIRFGDTGGGFITVQFNANTYIQWDPGSGKLVFYNNGAARMSLDGSGNLITSGTITPSGTP